MTTPPPPPPAQQPQGWPQQQSGWVPPPVPRMPPPVAPNGRPLASFGDRLAAYLIDMAIHLGVSLVLIAPLMCGWLLLVFRTVENDTPDPALIVGSYFLLFGAILVISIGFTYLYWVEYQLRHGGQTVGKRTMRLWVTPVAPGRPLTRGMLAKRWAVHYVGGSIVPGFSYVDGLWQLWDKPLQQCLHDKAAETVVVKVG